MARLDNGHYVVVLEAFAFDTRDEALTYAEKLTDVFCAMPESKGIGCRTRVEFVPYDDETKASE